MGDDEDRLYIDAYDELNRTLVRLQKLSHAQAVKESDVPEIQEMREVIELAQEESDELDQLLSAKHLDEREVFYNPE